MILTRARGREKSEGVEWLICEVCQWSYVFLQICVRIKVSVFVCMCMCVCVYVFVCVCACLSVCVIPTEA